MFPLPQALLMTGGLSSDIIFWAPLDSTTTNKDVTVNPLTASVVTPTGTSITYNENSTAFNSLGYTGGDVNSPSLLYAQYQVVSKLNPALYPTQTITLSGKITLSQYVLGGSGSCPILTYFTFATSTQLLAYVDASSVRILTLWTQTSTNTEFNGTWPAGENLFTMEWTPAGVISWYLNGTLLRSIQGARYNGQIRIGGSGYNQYTQAGVSQTAIRDVKYQVGPKMYAWSNTGGYQGTGYTSWSTADRAISWIPNSSATSMFAKSMQPLTGKVYCEFACTTNPSNMPSGFGVQSLGTNGLVNIFYNPSGGTMFTGNGGCGLPSSGLALNGAVVSSSSLYSFATGTRIGIAFDSTTKKVWFSKNGVWIQGDPATGTAPSLTLTTTAPFYFTMGAYSCNINSGTFTYMIYPDAATQLNSPPTGFSRYQPD